MIYSFSRITAFLCLIIGLLSLLACQQTELNPEIVTKVASPEVATPAATLDSLPEVSTPKATTVPLPEVTTPPILTTPPVVSAEKQATSWRRLDTTGGGGQTGIATHPTNPDVVYMASDNGGLFKTENGGDSWFSVSTNLGAYRLGFVILDPLDPDVIYVTASTDPGLRTTGGATGEIHRSVNGGDSWEFVTDQMGFQNSFPNQIALVIPYDQSEPARFDQDADSLSDVILVGAWTGPANPPVGGIWRSEDEGETFTQLALKDRNIMALRAFAADTDVLFATTYEGEIYQSDDLGESWESITGNMPLAYPVDLAIHPTDENILYVTCRWCQAGQPPVWKTTDGGQQWFPVSSGLDTNEVGSFSKILIDRFKPDTLYVTTDDEMSSIRGIFQSNDGGNSWYLMPMRLFLPDGRPYYRFYERGLALAQAVDGRLFSSGGGGWRYPDGDLADGVEEWEPATIGVGNIGVNVVEIDPANDAVVYQGIADFGPYKSVDRGLSFHRILGNGWPVTVKNYIWNGPYYSNHEKCRLACSSTCRNPESLASGGTTDFAISRQNSNVVYSSFGGGSSTSAKGGINKSTDGGQTWQPLGLQPDGAFELNPENCLPYGFKYLAIDPTNDSILFAAMEVPDSSIGKLYKTSDGGISWAEVVTTSTYIRGIEVSVLDPELVVFVTQKDVYKSEQGGEPGSWQVITPAEMQFGLRTVSLSPHQADIFVIGTNDQGIFYTSDRGATWRNNQLEGFFAQKLRQDSDKPLDPKLATALNPNVRVLRNISAIIFDPIASDTFYVGGTQHERASFGVARITRAGQNWERLPLAGLSVRNILTLTIDSSGRFLYAGTHDGTYRFELRPAR